MKSDGIKRGHEKTAELMFKTAFNLSCFGRMGDNYCKRMRSRAHQHADIVG